MSWQPSQLANFQTASFGCGARPSRSSQLPHRRAVRPDRVEGEHRAVDAEQVLAQLAVAAQAHAAAHVALQGQPDPFDGATPARGELRRDVAHHHLGPAHQRERPGGVERARRDQLGDQADASGPRGGRPVDGDRHLDVRPSDAQRGELVG